MSDSSIIPPIIGIDLGTTRSVVAHVDKYGNPYTIKNREGDATTPSVVLLEEGCVTIGKEALKAQAALPEQVATFAKREMGKSQYSRSVNGQSFPPEMIQSLILGRLRDDAEAKLGCKVQKAVITVPAYFNEPKRRSTIDAAQLAGIEAVAIINEPTAVSIAYGLSKHCQLLGPQTVLIYDLGGGTFDISLVHVDGPKIEVLATDGNAMLGGMDWDKCLVSWLDDQFVSKCKIRPSESEYGRAMLMRESEELKHTLSSRKEAKIRIAHDGKVLQTKIARQEFEELTAHLLDRTRFTVRQLMSESNRTWEQIDQLILVGGSTRMPQVKALLMKESGMEPNLTVSADEAIAHGAAIFAQNLPANAPRPEQVVELDITDVNAHNLGVLGVDTQTKMRANHIMIPRNTPLPAKQVTRFETADDNQRSVVVEVIEGGDSRGRHGTHIGRCALHDLPPNLPAGTPIDVTFNYTRDGLIRVQAKLPSTGQRAKIKIDRQAGHSDSSLDALRDIHLALGLED